MITQITNDSKYRRRVSQLHDRLAHWYKVGEIPLNTQDDVKDALTRLEAILDKPIF